MSYADTDIIPCILSEVLTNQGMWDAKLPLVVYVMVEMYESNRVMQQFDTMAYLEYLLWLKVAGKLYLLSVKVKSRQLRQKRQRRPLERQLRARRGCTSSSSSTRPEEASPMST
ncbi:hypothetical protein GOBAR_AA31894 [Gossypium barbadense]|uniref:Uncharacterized protein n=1 Tax=Gossypium barbadense TaxID=3634 RepID=A0A2P5WCI9_GOSBA|nr:hypothetical protein GOBAR_AA31894 [Gossypium barbadense]